MVRGRLVQRSTVALAIAAAALLAAQPAAANVESARPAAAPAHAIAETTDDGASTMALVNHRCMVIGRAAGYEAVHCADLDRFTNSAGQPGIRGQVQSLCQRASDGAPVRCEWIDQAVNVYNYTNGQRAQVVYKHCGGSPYPACGTGRLKALSAGLLVYCGHTYYSTVSSYIELPGRVGIYRMELDSYSYTPTSNCIRA